MKKYAGEEFLNKLYKDLVHGDEVKHTAKGANKNEDLAIYFERLERITNEVRDKDRLELLKYFYYKKYVIKEEDVPESYFELQKQIALERGYGHITYNEQAKKKEMDSIISEQRESLDRWLEYFVSEDTKYYPMWFKYYVFQNVMKIGDFDKGKKEYTKRTDSTVKPFIEINREAVSMLYDGLCKYLNKEEITDDQLEELIKNGSFNKIYSYITRKLDKVKKSNSTSNEGIWKKYNQGSNPEILFNDIHGKGTGWCTAGGLETARTHLNGGDFHVYFTKDENGEYTNPRIAIRMEYNQIAEIRGIAEHQNLENEMERVVEEKLDEFPDKEEYKKKVSDMKTLTIIYNKYKNNEELTKEDLNFLYETNSRIFGFGYEEDPRISEIINKRDIKKDLSYALDVLECQISFTDEEAMQGNIKYHYGDLKLYKKDFVSGMVLPEKIRGTLDLKNLTTVKGLILPKMVYGNLELDNIICAEGLMLPNYVGGTLDLRSLETAEGIVFPKEVGGDLFLYSLMSAKGLNLPRKVGGELDLGGLKRTENLILPERIGSDLDLFSLESAERLEFPEVINGSLNLNCLYTTEGLILPKKIRGDLLLRSLESAEGLVLPDEIDGELALSGLTIVKGLVFPRKIGLGLDLSCLESVEDVFFPEEVGGDLDLSELKNAKRIVFPKIIHGNLSLANLTYAEDLVLPEKIDGWLDMSNLTDLTGVVFPKDDENYYIPCSVIFSYFKRNQIIGLLEKNVQKKLLKKIL